MDITETTEEVVEKSPSMNLTTGVVIAAAGMLAGLAAHKVKNIVQARLAARKVAEETQTETQKEN